MKAGDRAVTGLGVLTLCAAVSCGGDSLVQPEADPENRPPTIAAIPDQTVVRNTLTPRSIGVDLAVEDPDDETLTIDVSSDDESIVPAMSFTCVPGGECGIEFTPAPERTAQTTVEVMVADGRGGEAQTSFRVDVVPLLVTNANDDGAGSLRLGAATAEPGDVIGFDTGGVFAEPRAILLSGQIVVDRSVTIEGPGAEQLIVSGNGAVRVFKVTGGASAVISGLTISEGRASLEAVAGGVGIIGGGGVFVDTGSRLTLRASTVSGNTADHPEGGIGGGIVNVAGTLIVEEDSRVIGNTATTGAGVATVSTGQAEAEATIENSTIADNTATGSGGGIVSLSRSTVVVAGSEIVRNTAGIAGGGIFATGGPVSGTVIVRAGSQVSENIVTGTGGFAGDGGGIHNHAAMTITESDVEGNTAAGRGGGVHNGGTLVVTGSRIAGNAANRDADSTFEDYGGGGISNRGAVVLEGSTVEGNQAVSDGGGVLNFGDGVMEITGNSRLVRNAADRLGGGIHNGSLGGASVTVHGSTVEDNTAREGAGIYNRAQLTLEDSRLADNIAVQHGGGLLTAGGAAATAVMTATTVQGNAALNGGGVYIMADLTIQEDTRIIENVAAGDGGGIYYHGSAISAPASSILYNSMVENNTAERGGGIFFVFRSGSSGGVVNFHVQAGSRVAGNTAVEGGGIYQTQTFGSGGNARMVIAASVIEGNTATGFSGGGGIMNEGGRITILANSLITNNTATNGGGIFNRENPAELRETTTTIQASTVSGNKADLAGGGIINRTTLNLGPGTLITGNTALVPGPSGGGIYNVGTINDSGGNVSGNTPDNIAP